MAFPLDLLRRLRGTHAPIRPGFYSPLVDTVDVLGRDAAFWQPEAASLGIDFRAEAQASLLDACAPFLQAYDYPAIGIDDVELDSFYDGNSQFGWLDARMLFALLQLWRPARVIEVGSGYSTLLMDDVNRHLLDGCVAITAIEPYPRPFMHRLKQRGVDLIERKVQDVPLETFDALQAGDVLFIDSSHVSKTGSDVNMLVFDVLPRLRAGVRIHVHDIFLPHEYPASWISEGRSWNEQYLIRALMQFGSAHFRILFGSHYAATCLPQAVGRAFNNPPIGGSSLWIEKV